MSSDITAAETEFMQGIKKNAGLTVFLGVTVALMGLVAMSTPCRHLYGRKP